MFFRTLLWIVRLAEYDESVKAVLMRGEAYHFPGTIRRHSRKTIPACGNIETKTPFAAAVALQIKWVGRGIREGGVREGRDASAPAIVAVPLGDLLQRSAVLDRISRRACLRFKRNGFGPQFVEHGHDNHP